MAGGLGMAEALIRHVQHLAGDIGPRPNGTPANHAAAVYIGQCFHTAGLQVEEQRFACPGWQHEETVLTVNGEALPAAANAFSPPCDVSAGAVPVGTLAELEAADLTGRVGVLYGDLAKAPLSPKAWPFKGEHDARIVQLLEEKRPAALVTVQSVGAGLDRLIEDDEFTIPSATVAAEAGLRLLRQDTPVVQLRIRAQRAASHASNMVARTPGAATRRLVFCAHYDTKLDTPGAFDNASGVAVLLALAERLGRARLACGLEWVAFTGEEYLPLGDDEYVRRGADTFGQIIAAINGDGVGQYLSPTSIALFSASPAFQAAVAQITPQYPDVVWVKPWPQSNHSTFAMRGVPSLALSSAANIALAHRQADTVDWVSPARLRRVAALVLDVVAALHDKSPEWTRGAPA